MAQLAFKLKNFNKILFEKFQDMINVFLIFKITEKKLRI
jgi:hypothetical protein